MFDAPLRELFFFVFLLTDAHILTIDVSNDKDGRVHFRNSGGKRVKYFCNCKLTVYVEGSVVLLECKHIYCYFNI